MNDFNGWKKYRYNKNNDRLNIKYVLYHGLLTPYSKILDWEGETLKSILSNGIIATREKLKEMLSPAEYLKIMKYKTTNWNRQNSVSVAQYTGTYDYFTAYWLYVDDNPSIILDPKLLIEQPYIGPKNQNNRKLMDGEYQILNSISLEYMLGFMLPNLLIAKKVEAAIDKDMISDLYNLSFDEIYTKYVAKAVKYEKILKDFGYPVNIFDQETGYYTNSCEEEFDKVMKLKKKM